MNEDIIRMAREAGFIPEIDSDITVQELKAFAALIRADEREACLKLATEPGRNKAGVAQAIRARSNK